ncbi:MAG: threonine-phosphate decarboxylase CobD [Pelosinus sp.]|nr:threonine-phosphate decarboxylase CobD [Pelosinus sp.]
MSGKSQFEHGGNVHAVWREQKNISEPLCDFSANINPLGLSGSVRQAILAGVENIVHYPDPKAAELKYAISSFYQVAEASITLGNGAVEPIYILCQILRPRSVLITAPTFSEYERAALASGAEIQVLDLAAEEDFFIDPAKIISRLSTVDMVFIANPNNPTGTLMPSGQLETVIAAAAKTDTLVVVDESFIDFLADGQQYTVKPLLAEYSNLVILQSMTKFYAIPGLRLGFVMASVEITRRLDLAKDPWNVNSLAQAAGIAALADRDYQQASIAYMAEANIALYQALNVLPGIKAFKPSVNFMLLDIKDTGLTAAKLCELSAARNILLRDCSNYRGLSNQYIRTAVKRTEDNTRLVKVLNKITQEGTAT